MVPCPPTSHTDSEVFLSSSTVATLKPTVGEVSISTPRCCLYSKVDFPAKSKPMRRTWGVFLNCLDLMAPILMWETRFWLNLRTLVVCISAGLDWHLAESLISLRLLFFFCRGKSYAKQKRRFVNGYTIRINYSPGLTLWFSSTSWSTFLNKFVNFVCGPTCAWIPETELNCKQCKRSWRYGLTVCNVYNI